MEYKLDATQAEQLAQNALGQPSSSDNIVVTSQPSIQLRNTENSTEQIATNIVEGEATKTDAVKNGVENNEQLEVLIKNMELQAEVVNEAAACASVNNSENTENTYVLQENLDIHYNKAQKNPCEVYVDIVFKAGQPKPINAVNLSFLLKTLNIEDIKEITKTGFKRCKVEFKNAVAANKFLSDTRLNDNGYTALSSAPVASKAGLIFNIATAYTMKNLAGSISSPVPMLRLYRCTKQNPNNKSEIIKIDRVKIVFAGESLPEEIEIGGAKFKVAPFISFAERTKKNRNKYYRPNGSSSSNIGRGNKVNKYVPKPWWDAEATRLFRKRNAARQKYNRSHKFDDAKTYSDAENQFKNYIAKRKREYNRMAIDNSDQAHKPGGIGRNTTGANNRSH